MFVVDVPKHGLAQYAARVRHLEMDDNPFPVHQGALDRSEEGSSLGDMLECHLAADKVGSKVLILVGEEVSNEDYLVVVVEGQTSRYISRVTTVRLISGGRPATGCRKVG